MPFVFHWHHANFETNIRDGILKKKRKFYRESHTLSWDGMMSYENNSNLIVAKVTSTFGQKQIRNVLSSLNCVNSHIRKIDYHITECINSSATP